MSASRKSVQTLIAQLLVFLQGLVLIPIIIKVSGPEMFGSYVLLISYLGIIFGVSSLGVGISAKRWLPSTPEMQERAGIFFPQFWFQVLTVSVFALVSVLAYTLFAYLGYIKFSGFIASLIPAYLLAYTIYSQSSDYFRYTHRVGVYNIIAVAQPYLYVFLVLAVYYISDVLDTATLICSTAIACVLVGSIFFTRIINEIGFKLCLFKRQSLVKEISLGFPLVLSYLVEIILSSGDRYVIAAMLAIEDVGFYVPAYIIGSLLMVLPKVFGVVLPPLLSRTIDADDNDGAKRLSTNAARIFLMISVPYAFGSVFFGQEILQIYTNDEIARAAWPVIPVVALASIFYGLIMIKSNILFVRLRTGVLFQINALSAVLNIVLNVVLLNLFGDVVMAAVATLVSYMMSYILLSRKIKDDVIDFQIDSAWLLHIILASCGMGLVLTGFNYMVDGESIIRLVIGIILGCATYASLILMRSDFRSEIYSFAKIFKAGRT